MPKKQVSIDLTIVRQMRKAKVSWVEIGAKFGVSAETVQRRMIRAGDVEIAEPEPAPIYVKDNRSWQQRLFGDPIPARSALAMKGQR